jgi:hypothetical protein
MERIVINLYKKICDRQDLRSLSSESVRGVSRGGHVLFGLYLSLKWAGILPATNPRPRLEIYEGQRKEDPTAAGRR